MPTFADRGVSRGQRNGSPQPLIYCFLNLEPLLFFSIQVAPQLTSRGWVDPRSRPTTTTTENLVAPGIEPGTSVSVVRNSGHLDHRGGHITQYARGTSVSVVRNSGHLDHRGGHITQYARGKARTLHWEKENSDQQLQVPQQMHVQPHPSVNKVN